jgi:signal transduction histidine kinase
MARGNTPSEFSQDWHRYPGPAGRRAASRSGQDQGTRPRPALWRTWLPAASVGVLVVAWVIVIFTVEQARFAILAPEAQVGVEAAAALARLFGALVLLLFPIEAAGQRLRWVASGFLVLALGGLLFGYAPPLLDVAPDLNTSIYAWLVVRSVAGVLFVVGLVPAVPPPCSRRLMLVTLIIVSLLSLGVVVATRWLPPLTTTTALDAVVASGHSVLPGLTGWHWLLSSLPLGLALLAVVGAARHQAQGRLGGWLLVAMVLLAGSQVHNLFWPSAYSPVLTTADLLRLAFAAVVAVGGILELRRIAAERAALLAAERDAARRLTELAVLKADFTAMVAHELSSPLAAIRAFADMLATGDLRPAEQATALAAIGSEVDLLQALVADVQTAAAVERDDFAVQFQPVPVVTLLEEAAAYARTLPGAHPVTVSQVSQALVRADPERIAQVLRNLLSNAAKYSPDGAPIEVRACEAGGRVRIEVDDRGYGIEPADLIRIFEKFGRGRDRTGRQVPGVGLGLYLSRRIVQAHGGDLTVASTPGAGSVFAFELEVVR